MIKTIVSKILWLVRGASMTLGLAIMLTVVLGVGTTALAAVPGDPFRLGQVNLVNTITRLAGDTNTAMLRINNGSTGPTATALDLQVAPGRPPMTINSSTEVQNLNADSLDSKNSSDFLGRFQTASNAAAVDGKSADQIGVNGQQVVSADSANNSDSPKIARAECPAGKVLVGTGYDILGAKTGDSLNQQTDIVLDELRPGPSSVFVQAYEEASTAADWRVTASAVCATAP